MGGASKSLGLPQVKLGWAIVGGPEDDRAAALDGLELIADTFLSVGTPVQMAAPELLRRGAVVRQAIHARVRANLTAARRLAARLPRRATCCPWRAGGRPSCGCRRRAAEEALVLDLLAETGILIHPGYFFDFEHEAFLVFSLLVPEDVFADAFDRTLRFAVAA